MAKSEHQGLQIALILFVMIAVVLAITTFVYYREAEEASKRVADATKKFEDAKATSDNYQSRVEYVLHILGTVPRPDAEVELLKQSFGGDEQMKKVMADYDSFISVFGSGMPKDKQNYSGVSPQVLTALRNAYQALSQQTAENTKMAKDIEEIRDKEDKRTQVAMKGQTDAEKKLADEKTKYEEDRKSLEDKQTTQLASFNEAINKKTTELEKSTEAQDALKKEVQKRETVITDQAKTIVTLRDEPFEVSDGQVTWVNQAAKTVWINLGLADGLRRQTLFSVFDQADNGVTRTDRKASVEVTRVLDQHLAEARIVSDSAANPILPGDQIFSPAWRPGKRVRFALAGLIDIDGDSRSDRVLVRSLLAASGGQIDAEMHDDGQIEGKITSATRYLVLGEQPDERSDPKILAAYSQMMKEADQLGVERIPVTKLLDWAGYRPEVRSVGLGKNADPSQFKPKPPEGKAPTSTGNVSEKFRERRPGDKAKSDKSAFGK